MQTESETKAEDLEAGKMSSLFTGLDADAELVKYLDRAAKFLNSFREIAEKQKNKPELIRELDMSFVAVLKAKSLLGFTEK